MPLNLNRFSRRVTIQQRATTDDAIGQPVETWATVCEVWAYVKAPTGMQTTERAIADREASPTTYSIRIRYRTDITAAMRVVLGTTTFAISDVIEDFAGREYLDLVCVAGVGDG
jgi:SPP1 family predicted phage head-tail adaptor